MEIDIGRIDQLLIVFIAIAMPILSYWSGKIHERRLEGSDRAALSKTYNESLFLLWPPTLFVVAFWLYSGRSFDVLGLSFTGTLANWLGLLVALIVAAGFAWQVRQVKTHKDLADQVINMLNDAPGVARVLPQSVADYRKFKWLSITAGITEEILFRGFLIWAFSHWMPVWGAAVLALAIFTVAHLYQGQASALLKVGMTGAVLTLLYLLSGSLIPAIILHAAIDLSSGAMCWHARKRQDLSAT